MKINPTTTAYNEITCLPERYKSFCFDDILVMQSKHIILSYSELFRNENFSRFIELGTCFGGLPLFVRKFLNFEGDIITYEKSHDPIQNEPIPKGHSEYIGAPNYPAQNSSEGDGIDKKARWLDNDWSAGRTIDEVSPYMAYLHLQNFANQWPSSIDGGLWFKNLTPPDILGKLAESNIDYRVKDVFSPATEQEIVDLIQSDGKTLLLCDNGDKPHEINTYAKYLKRDDIILGHDYSKDGLTDIEIWPHQDWSRNQICGSWPTGSGKFTEGGIESGLDDNNQYADLFAQSATFIGIKTTAPTPKIQSL